MENTQEWNQYESGLKYQSKINLLATADKNERFYVGRQWEGVKSNGLPTPILNITRRIIDFKISMVMSDMISMQFTAEGIADDTDNETEKFYRKMAALLSDYSRTAWETLKLDTLNENGLLNATLSGDMVSYWYWNDLINAGNEAKGDLCGELVDNVNYFPGDPNSDEVNNIYGPVQPYILLAFRRQVEDVRLEAKKNGVQEEDLKLISADSETQNQPGDMSKTELDPEKDGGKCIVLLKLWKELEEVKAIHPVSGEEIIVDRIWHIKAKKSTRSVVVRDTWDTGLHRYPVAVMNWGKRKGSAYGEAEATSLIPNQILINQMAAMMALWVKLHGFPKVIFDKTSIESWNNDLSLAIGVNGPVANVAQYMLPAQISSAVQNFMEWFIQVTKEMAGANEAVLGEANPVNTSAIIVLQKATAVPLNSIKRRFYRYIEDIGLIWLDFWLSKYAEYPERLLEITRDNIKTVVPFDAKALQNVRFKLKIDVGPSTQWNEAAAVQTLDNLLQNDYINFIEYLKRLPNGLIPDKQGLIDSREKNEKFLLYELMARYVDMLPPEQKQQLMSLPPDQMEESVKQMIMENETQREGVRPYAENVRAEALAS